ncbi:MAG: diaminopimelate epimerase [Luteimonas sp.]
MGLRFSKMHGAGNDFVILDLRGGKPSPPDALVRAIGDRHRGVGFDQLLSIDDSRREDCVAAYRIWNTDGSRAEQCGNGARCVAAWVMRAGMAAAPRFSLDSPAGPIVVDCLDDGQFALDMGAPIFAPAAIPLSAGSEGGGSEGGGSEAGGSEADGSEAEVYSVIIDGRALRFGAASMGNPHAVIEVDSVDDADVEGIGRALQQSSLFPASVNVGFAQVIDPGHIKLRVYERGAGETLACGSGACAAVAVLARQGLVGTHVAVDLPGGRLTIDWPGGDAAIRMAGPATFVFEGEWQE